MQKFMFCNVHDNLELFKPVGSSLHFVEINFATVEMVDRETDRLAED